MQPSDIILAFSGRESTNFSVFGRESTNKHCCEIILKSVHRPRRRCHLNGFYFLALTVIMCIRAKRF